MKNAQLKKLKGTELNLFGSSGHLYKCHLHEIEFPKGITLLDKNGGKRYCLRANMVEAYGGGHTKKYRRKFMWLVNGIKKGEIDLRKDKFRDHTNSTSFNVTCAFE